MLKRAAVSADGASVAARARAYPLLALDDDAFDCAAAVGRQRNGARSTPTHRALLHAAVLHAAFAAVVRLETIAVRL